MLGRYPIGRVGTDLNDKSQAEAEVSDKLGILHLDLTGKWTVEEFRRYLGILERSYLRLNLIFSGDNTNNDANVIDIVRIVNATDVELKAMFEASAAFIGKGTAQLKIDRLELASPGFAELVGNLNPLKIIVDFIAEWRREN